MIDDYPEFFLKYVVKREQAKRAKKEAARLQKECDDCMKNCLEICDQEVDYNVDDLESEIADGK